MTRFQEKLRSIRKSKGINIRALALKAGVSASYISMQENGRLTNDPTIKIIKLIENALGCNDGDLSKYWKCPCCGKSGLERTGR